MTTGSRALYGVPATAVLSVFLAVPVQAQTDFTIPVYPSRKRYEEDTCQKVRRALESGREQYLLDLINADPIVCRYALLRLLEDPAGDATSLEYARLFPFASLSAIEEPLVQFVSAKTASIRKQVLGAFFKLNDLYLAARRTAFGDHFSRKLQSALGLALDNVAESLASLGFDQGRAEALYLKSRYLLEFSSPELPIVAQESIDIFERHGNVRGQFNGLIRLASYHYFRGIRRDDPEHSQKATELIQHYVSLVESTDDDLLKVYMKGRLPDDYTDQGNWTEDQWVRLEKTAGLPFLKAKYLLWLSEKDESHLGELEALVSEQQDPVLQAKLYYRIFTETRSIEALSQAIRLADGLEYDISAFDWRLGNYSQPPVAAVPHMLSQLSGALQNSLRFDEARQANKRAVDYLDSTHGFWSRDQLAMSQPALLRRLVADYRKTGDYARAIETATKVMDVSESAGKIRLLRDAARDLSGLHAELRDFHSGEAALLRARSILESDLLEVLNLDLVVLDFINLDLAVLNLGFSRYDQALRWISVTDEQRSARNPNFLKNATPDWENTRLTILSFIWRRLGDFEKALEFATILEERDLPSATSLGDVLIELERYEEARDYFRRRLDRYRDKNRRHVAHALKSLGRIHRLTSNLKEASKCLTEALDFFRVRGNQHSEQEVLRELALIAIGSDRPQEASQLLRESLQIAEALGDFHAIWSSHFHLGSIAERRGEKPLAVSHYRAAVEAVEAVSSHVTVEADKATFLKDKTQIFDRLIRLLGPTEPREAFHYAERRRAQAYLDAVRSRGLGKRQLSSGLLRERRRVEALLIGKQTALRDQLSVPPERRDEKLMRQLGEELADIRPQHAEVLRSIHLRNSAEAYREGILRPLRAEEVQTRVLQPGQILVEYVVSDDAVYAFVLSRSECRFYRLFGNRAELGSEIDRLLEPFRLLRDGSVDLLHVDFDVAAAHRIFQQIFQPLEPALRNAEELVIVPDDVLHYVPFEALPRRPDLGPRNRRVRYAEYTSVDWLLRHYNIEYAVSATSLDPQIASKEDVPRTLLAFAEPLIRPEPNEKPGFTFRGSTGSLEMWGSLAPLRRAVEEVDSVAELTGDRLRVTKLTGPDASERAYFEQAPQAGYLHFAVHSVVDEELPDYSALVLARDDSADGFLQTFEISEAELNAALVVLSACETGLGRLYRGEGLMGLKRAFLVAGARSVMVSLWSVEDSTADFIAEFYRQFDVDTSISGALRQAKLAYLEKSRPLGGSQAISLSHPLFWAPMTLTVSAGR